MKSSLNSRRHGMTMLKPAADWREAMPSGNGSIGALVYGCIYQETVVLNHEALWYGGCRQPLPDMAQYLPELRRLLAEGDYAAADRLYIDKMNEAGFNPIVPKFHPAFDLKISMETEHAFRDFRRYLDFETGEIQVSWKGGAVKYERRLFVSCADDVAVLVIRSEPAGHIVGSFRLAPHDFTDALTSDGKPFTPVLTFDSAAENGWLILLGDGSDGGEFGGLARTVSRGGTLVTDGDSVRIDNADEVLVLVGLYANEPSKPALQRLRRQLETLPDNYDSLFSRHSPLHRDIFMRTELDLDAKDSASKPNEILVLDAYSGDVPTELIERMFDYGRYLLLCSSRPGGLPANLQGVWNGDYEPPWHCFYTNNENVQMNYWQALPGNMPETTEAYFDYYDSLMPDFRENARKLWGCRGIYIPLVTVPGSGLLSNTLSHVIHWTGAAGWLAQLYYDYWLFTEDRKFLEKRALPFMKEIALFYEDFITKDAEGYNFFTPSNSPENAPGNTLTEKDVGGATMNPGIPVTVNATMDTAIAKELLGNLCSVCEILGIEQDNLPKWQKLLEEMRPYQINEDGAISEWMHPDLTDNYQHRHLSHLYPLFPGFEITEERAPKLFDACKVAVEKRLCIGLRSQTGWSLAHMGNIYARLGLGDEALECLKILSRSCLGENLFTYHNDWRDMGITLKMIHGRNAPFQIDANMGWTAAVLEMLVFSTPTLIKLLPALPTAWNRGKIKNVLCRGGTEVSIEWDRPKHTISVRLCSKSQRQVLLKFPGKVSHLESSIQNAVTESEKGPAYRYLALPAKREITLRCRWE